MKVVTFDITTDASGDYSATTPIDASGPWLLYAVQWVDGDLADGVDAVLSATSTPSGVDTTLLTLTDANSDAWYYPRIDAHSTAGAALSSGADVTAERAVQVVHGQLKLVVSSGGNAASGKALVYLKCA